ncbi:MAG: hypothetical protein H6900_06525 [Rhodobacter sp.]|uniref:LCCL domain-containing protein n=1 Tax=Pararhodobacter sp. TaxID=2127056 RepID=UPI002BB17BAA|nr:LCCL domain-containing protein [Pararhodobacter sp.]MCC0072931.1 hypothetical protein [Rhodobacter sp.]HPD94027.1 LCCL domain-containing protein [Pararhodobacter sp.]
MLTKTLRLIPMALAALGTSGGIAAAQSCPDWSLTGAQIAYSTADLAMPRSHPVVAGGNVDLSQCGLDGWGYVVTQPDFDLTVTDNSGHNDLEIRVNAACDTVLLVNDANGQWHFNDDTNGVNPAVRLTDAPAGAYDVWVGTFGTQTCQAALELQSYGAAAMGGQDAGKEPGGQAEQPQVQAMPDPGNLVNYRNQVGQTLAFTVTGTASGSVWGSGVYTDDSSLAAAAVHAGVLRVGETGTVQVTILPGQQSYQASAANGVRSSNYGSWTGSYSFVYAPAQSAAPAPAPAPAPTPEPSK